MQQIRHPHSASRICSLHWVFCLWCFFSSSIIFPTLVNKGLIEGNFIKNGRYGVTNPALETIASQDEPAIITIGSSILEYATDGQCISERLHANDTKVYNLAISGGNPYTELLQVPALIEAKPKAVLLDLGPKRAFGNFLIRKVWMNTSSFDLPF